MFEGHQLLMISCCRIASCPRAEADSGTIIRTIHYPGKAIFGADLQGC